MSKKTKFDYEIEEFDKAFSSFREKKIVVYGTGRVTATLIEKANHYNIIGLCDRDETLVGKEIYGKKIISREQAEEEGDIIIINTASTYWNTIYKRISDWKLPIYYRNGTRAMMQHNEKKDDPYWEVSVRDLKKEIAEHDIISFDVFGTLIMRKVVAPIDVFRMIEEKLNTTWRTATNYTTYRKQAESVQTEATLEEIYQHMCSATGWEHEKIEFAKTCELEIDKLLITTRDVIADVCNTIPDSKTVYFISDMHYSRETILEILLSSGINASLEQILVSSELKKSKAQGTLWKWYKENIVKEKSALHIGDDRNSDCREAEKHGINSFYIMNPSEMLEHSSIKDIIPQIVSIQSSLAVGLITARLFNDPFAMNACKSKIRFQDEPEAGYILLGNIVYNFMTWLLEHAEEDGIDKLIFFAREAYFLIREYRYMCKLLGKDDAPEAVYLEISRRAIWNASIGSEDDFYEIATGFPYVGSVQDFLLDRFGIKAEDETLDDILTSDIQQNETAFWNIIEPYIMDIFQGLKSERENYLRYLKSLNLTGNLGIIDSFLSGTTQFYFGKVLRRKLKGYYFVTRNDSSNRYFPENDMCGCFQQADDLCGKRCQLLKNSIFIESFFTAPNGMLIKIGDDGEACYAEEMSNQKHFGVRLQMDTGINSFVEDMVEIQKKLGFGSMKTDPIFADKLFGVFMNDGFEPTEKMLEGFYFDDGILNHRETQIWG